SPRAGKSVPHQVAGAGKQPRRQLLELRLHLHCGVLVHPAARLNVDLFSGSQSHLKNISIAVHPHNTVALKRAKMIDEESGAAQQHIRYALDARERIVDAPRCGEELMLSHVESFTAAQVNGEDMPRAVAAKSDLPGTACLRQKYGHSSQYTLESALQGPHAN